MEGARVRTARAEAGLTLMKLADKSGVTRDTISKIERGVHTPQAGTLAKLAKALDRPVSYFTEEGELPKDEARLPLEWARAAAPEELSQTIRNAHTEVLKDLYQDAMSEVWASRDERGFLTKDAPRQLLNEIGKELRRRDPPAFSIKTSRDTIEVRWLVPLSERAPYRELLIENLQELIEGEENGK